MGQLLSPSERKALDEALEKRAVLRKIIKTASDPAEVGGAKRALERLDFMCKSFEEYRDA